MHVRPVDSADDWATFESLVREYARSLPIDLGFQGFDDELRSLGTMYGAPDGRALVPVKGPRDGNPLASNALIIAGVYLGVKVVIPMTRKLGMALINRIALS